MDEGQLIEKLKEYEDTQNKIISSVKECVNSINEILTLVYSAGSDIPNIPHDPAFQLSRIYWNDVFGTKIIFFAYIVDGKIYSINNEGSDIYFGNPPFMIKITNADNNIIIEYIKSILRIKKHIIIDIENKINSLKETSDELNKFLDDIKLIIPQ
jgi:hypothetical protein